MPTIGISATRRARMLPRGFTIVLLVLPLSGMTLGTHDDGCVPGVADPSTINLIDLTGAGGPLYYLEERANPLGTSPPIPFSSFFLGEGTYLYQEINGLAGLQRGGPGLPYCLIEFFCEFPPHDPLNDENCGHGPDQLMY